jgi:hypothetical protein
MQQDLLQVLPWPKVFDNVGESFQERYLLAHEHSAQHHHSQHLWLLLTLLNLRYKYDLNITELYSRRTKIYN